MRFLLLAGAAYLAAGVLVVLARNHIIFPIRGGLTDQPHRFGFTDGERVTIPTADGESLAAWWLPPRGAGPVGAVVWFHGNAETVRALSPVIRELRPPSAGMLILEYRGYGESTGRTTVEGTLRDAEAAWDWLVRRPGVDSARIVAYGRSVGAGPAAHLARVRPVAGLILESAFTSLRAMARRHYPIFPSALAGGGYDNLSAVSRVRAPVLVIHGETDDIVPANMGRALAGAAAGPSQFWEVKGTGHNDIYDARLDEYAWRFKAFVARVAE